MTKVGIHNSIPVSGLRLDKENPRIKKWLAMYGDNPSAEAIHQALGHGGESGKEAGTTYASLKESIRTNGGIIHPIIVNNDGNDLVVIDGNTRLTIYQTLGKDGTEGNWDLIPSIVYDKLDEESIDAIRLNSHLVGPRPWDPYSKAKYLHHLRTKEHMPFERLVDYCGGRKAEVENFIAAYAVMENNYRNIVDDDEFDTTRFSAFVEIQKGPANKALLDHGLTFDDFSEWVRDGLFDRLEDVRQLPRILHHERARETFLKDGSRATLSLLSSEGGSKDLEEISLEVLCSVLSNKLRAMTIGELQHLKENSSSELAQNLLDVFAQLQMISGELEGSEE